MTPKEIQIKAKEETLKGIYSNLVIVSHSKEEFCFDFLFHHFSEPLLVARIIVSPSHAKRIMKVLQENLKIYEEKFGKIKDFEEEPEKIGFRG